jgi:hypothetical protein
MATGKSEHIDVQENAGEASSARSAVILAIAVVIVAVLAVQFGLQTLVWIESRIWASQSPWLKDVPQALPAPSPSATPSDAAKTPKPAQIKLYDYEFTAPWPGNTKITRGQISSEVRFDSGHVIVFFDPESQLNTIRDMKTKNVPGYQQLSNVFGDQTPDTDYELYKTAYSASPAQVSPFIRRADALRINGALLYKLGFGYDALPGIHSFELGKNRGFQFGDPEGGRPVALRVFDERDDQLRLIFTVAAGTNAKITQDDIDTAVQSLQVVPLLER